MRFAVSLSAIFFFGSAAGVAADWEPLAKPEIAALQDDDLDRHRADPEFLTGINVSESRFSENGFEWHLLRFENVAQPVGPLWAVPHDDENAAFDAMVAALKRHGGVGIAVNSGPGSLRRQTGFGPCGVRAKPVAACDPNRNFDARTPLFTSAILSALPKGQPIIALHTNGDGFSGDSKGGRGDITLLDAAAFRQGRVGIRDDGYAGQGEDPLLDDPDVYAILPYTAATDIAAADKKCRAALNAENINVWHEKVRRSDGSLSNYVALNLPLQAYVNFEAQRDDDLAPAAEAQRHMIDAYMKGCAPLGDQPTALPLTGG